MFLGTIQSKDGKYELTAYSAGGSVRNKLTGEIVSEYVNFFTSDNTIHPETEEKLKLIEKEFNFEIKRSFIE